MYSVPADPFASADIHWHFLRGRAVVTLCPKLDRTDPYVLKLAAIMKQNPIKKILAVVMDVPCCQGLTRMVLQAWELSGRDDLVIEQHVVEMDGNIKEPEIF